MKKINKLTIPNFKDEKEERIFWEKNDASDYFDLSMLLGSPPKVIWVNVGNSSTLNLINILKSF